MVKEYEKICNNIILCSGTVLGKNKKILEYLKLLQKIFPNLSTKNLNIY